MKSEVLLGNVKKIISTSFNVDLDQVTPETSYESVEKWDSIGHLMLILELEQQFSVQFDPMQVEQMTSVAAIVHMLERVPAYAAG
jgi:acyl carrier protein